MKYLQIFIFRWKISLASAAVYRMNFFLMLIQSMVNSGLTILCFEFIYSSVVSIAGWTKHEMFVLLCTSLIINQLYRALIYFNQNNFMGMIGNGGFDRLILRPLNLMFQINIGYIDISSMFSIVAPLVILIVQIDKMHIHISQLQMLLYLVFIINGVVLLAAFMLLIFSLSFVFIKVDGLNNIYYLMMEMVNKPKEIFSTKFIYCFLFVIPVIPIANTPAIILIDGIELSNILITFSLTIIFLFLSYMSIRLGCKRYTSASS